MIPHLKALIITFQNQERYWAWHHSEGGHALLTEKALPLLKYARSFRYFRKHILNKVKIDKIIFVPDNEKPSQLPKLPIYLSLYFEPKAHYLRSLWSYEVSVLAPQWTLPSFLPMIG